MLRISKLTDYGTMVLACLAVGLFPGWTVGPLLALGARAVLGRDEFGGLRGVLPVNCGWVLGDGSVLGVCGQQRVCMEMVHAYIYYMYILICTRTRAHLVAARRRAA